MKHPDRGTSRKEGFSGLHWDFSPVKNLAGLRKGSKKRSCAFHLYYALPDLKKKPPRN